jgi:hypothetical protein
MIPEMLGNGKITHRQLNGMQKEGLMVKRRLSGLVVSLMHFLNRVKVDVQHEIHISLCGVNVESKAEESAIFVTTIEPGIGGV